MHCVMLILYCVCFFKIFIKFSKAILIFSQKTSHASAVLIIHLKNCSKNSFLSDDIITTSSDKLLPRLGKTNKFHFS